jgi:hypothetical protein
MTETHAVLLFQAPIRDPASERRIAIDGLNECQDLTFPRLTGSLYPVLDHRIDHGLS